MLSSYNIEVEPIWRRKSFGPRVLIYQCFVPSLHTKSQFETQLTPHVEMKEPRRQLKGSQRLTHIRRFLFCSRTRFLSLAVENGSSVRSTILNILYYFLSMPALINPLCTRCGY